MVATVEEVQVPQVASLRRFGLPSRPEIGSAQRTIKMQRPVCNEQTMAALGRPETEACQAKHNFVPRWWEKCTHGPYFSYAERPVNEPILEAIVDEQGNDTGRFKILGRKEELYLEEVPNLVQVAVSARVNSGLGYHDALAKGFRLPEECGIAPFCDYRDCWSQDVIVHSQWGNYCSEPQARYVGANEDETLLLHTDARRQRSQIAKVAL